jgi:FkbM family methyltransferase
MRSFYRPPGNCQIPNLAGKWQALFGGRNSGYFVEVGAYDGENYSNTSCLADVGWSGLYIEAVSEFAERCRARHKNNTNVNVIIAAASDREGSAELFLGDTLTTLSQDRPNVYNRIEWARGLHTGVSETVRTSTLDSLLEAHHVPARFDLLVIDVEGAEEKVLFGFDLLRWRPKVMVIELEDFHPDFADHDEIVHSAARVREKVISAGYKEYYRDIINTIFVDKEAFSVIPQESRVTIGLPVHNGSKTLRRALDSVLAQDYPHFDLVISDNASTDETAAIIEDYSTKFKRLSVIHCDVKISAIDNFLSVLDNCDTEFFVWIADDDWWEPQFLSKCLARLSEDPATHLAFTDFRVYYHFLDLYSARHSYVASDANDSQLNFLVRIFDMAPCAFYGVYRTAAVKAVAAQERAAFDFSDVVLTLAIALRGKIAIVKEDLFRAGVRDRQSVVRRSLDGGQIKYSRFLKEACTLALRGFGLRPAVFLIPQIVFKIYMLRRHNQSVAKVYPEIDQMQLYRRLDLPEAAVTLEPEVHQKQLYRRLKVPEAAKTDLIAFLRSQALLLGVDSEQAATFNSRTRDAWVKAKAKTISAGARVLDVGAGTAPYRELFAHCDYRTHDFAQYKKYQNGAEGNYTALDYVSDICQIPVPDASFDIILCTEVLEHVPRPIEALQEMARIVKPGGRLLITAPLGSGMHQVPYHFYGGYTEYWYRKFLAEFGCEIVEVAANHGFFANLAQECCRFAWTFDQHKALHGAHGGELYDFMLNVLAPYIYAMDNDIKIPEFTIGFHVEARRNGSKG